jgi:hypothetical protein
VRDSEGHSDINYTITGPGGVVSGRWHINH